MEIHSPDPAGTHANAVASAHIVFRSSAIHGTGGFARADIPVGTRLIEYVGERISKAEALRRCESNNPYIFSLDDEFDLDGDVSWNPARFLNHSCAPNCEAWEEKGRIWIVTIKPVSAGEEITFNYGYDLEDYLDYPCRCGAPSCVGYMVADKYYEDARKSKATQQT